jgi:NAD(P)-dependent dehydrogenase (short-subunit alcohol dehydrogenase family)
MGMRGQFCGQRMVIFTLGFARNNKISLVLCDLTKLNDVRNAIEEIRSQHEMLDGLFVNAGLGYAAKGVDGNAPPPDPPHRKHTDGEGRKRMGLLRISHRGWFCEF